MLYHCRILNCLEIRVPTLPGVKVVGLNLGISLVVSDIWVGWSDSVVYRNTSQPEQLPLCPSRLCRKRILTQFWHDCWLKLNLLWKPGLVFLGLLLSLSNAFIFFVLFFFKKKIGISVLGMLQVTLPDEVDVFTNIWCISNPGTARWWRESLCKCHYSNESNVPAERNCPLGGECRGEDRLIWPSFPNGQLLTLLEI